MIRILLGERLETENKEVLLSELKFSLENRLILTNGS